MMLLRVMTGNRDLPYSQGGADPFVFSKFSNLWRL